MYVHDRALDTAFLDSILMLVVERRPCVEKYVVNRYSSPDELAIWLRLRRTRSDN